MEKKLIEVMPELSISPELKECADNIRVNKICLTRDRGELHIYVNSNRLISKRSVFVLESAIKAQLFSKKDIKVHIFEHFQIIQLYLLLFQHEFHYKNKKIIFYF